MLSLTGAVVASLLALPLPPDALNLEAPPGYYLVLRNTSDLREAMICKRFRLVGQEGLLTHSDGFRVADAGSSHGVCFYGMDRGTFGMLAVASDGMAYCPFPDEIEFNQDTNVGRVQLLRPHADATVPLDTVITTEQLKSIGTLGHPGQRGWPLMRPQAFAYYGYDDGLKLLVRPLTHLEFAHVIATPGW